MARTTTPGAPAGEVVLELDRFGWDADGRLEIEGRWSGIRGRRFVRPTLVLADSRRPVLAVLDDKPWAAEDGDRWRAAFPLVAQDLDGAVLAVAPGIEVPLPRLSAAGKVSGPRTRPAERRFAREAPPAPPPRPRVATPRAEAPRAATPRAEARPAETPSVETSPQVSLPAEPPSPEPSSAADAELVDRLRAERDGAIAARELALRERDELAAERAALVAARDTALAERDAARAELGGIAGIVEARERLERDLAEAIAERDAHERRRDRADRLREELEAERDTAVAERDALRRERATIAPTPELRRAIFRREPDEPPAVLWASRIIALVALAAGLTLLALFFSALVSS